jgi:hypothetical protein
MSRAGSRGRGAREFEDRGGRGAREFEDRGGRDYQGWFDFQLFLSSFTYLHTQVHDRERNALVLFYERYWSATRSHTNNPYTD